MAVEFSAGAAAALCDVLFNKVTDMAIAEIKKVVCADEAFNKLELTYFKTRNLLVGFDNFDMKINTDILLQKRINTLNTLSIEAADLIGDIKSQMCPNSGSCKNPVRNAVLTSPGNLTKPRNFINLQVTMDKMLEELNELMIYIRIEEPTEAVPYNHPRNSEIPFVGRKDDLEEIIRALIFTSDEHVGVSILGTRGLGKTTLAQAIMKKLKGLFSIIVWVDVPDGNFNLETTMDKWDQSEENEATQTDNDVLNQGGGKAIIIFDNLLSVSLNDWEAMRSYIRSKAVNGKTYTNIKFLITTFRWQVVANTRTSSYYLKPLCERDCSKVIDAAARSSNPSLFESHPQEHTILTLARNSGGLPLVAHRLGLIFANWGVARLHNDLKDPWNSDALKDEISQHLKPCYSVIENHLKQHFEYFSLFPIKYQFTVDELVHLWCAQEFIEGSNLIRRGKDHFLELLGMSVLLSSDETTYNKMPTYEFNQFLAQLASASSTCLHLRHGVLSPNNNTLYLSFSYNNQRFPDWKELQKFKHLRTIFALSKSNIGRIPPSAFKKLKHLRVLSLRGSEDVAKLPDSIDRLTSLHYLDISDTPLKSLPESLSKLRALQFLKLKKETGEGLRALPKNFQNLTSMIYIDWDVSDIKHMVGLPIHIGKLSNLQTLPLFPVKNIDGYRISELKNMNDLQGSICITDLENVEDWAASRKAALKEKSFKQVELQWTSSKFNAKASKNTLSGLEPTEFLKQLTITNYGGDEFPDWMTNSLLELEEMHIHNCPRVKGLPKHKSVPSLRVLMLEEITDVLKVDHHFFGEGNFPKLESLELADMEKLEEWIMGPEPTVMPQLKVLKFGSCPKLTSVSSLQHLSKLEKLEIQRCGAWRSLPDLPGSLYHLIIIESDLLEERYKNGCDDWQKVDCINKVEIGYQIIQTSGSKVLEPTC